VARSGADQDATVSDEAIDILDRERAEGSRPEMDRNADDVDL
jgi:hypothetical protein